MRPGTTSATPLAVAPYDRSPEFCYNAAWLLP